MQEKLINALTDTELKAVLDGEINPGKVFTHSYELDQINQAYQDMATRKAIKSYIVFAD